MTQKHGPSMYRCGCHRLGKQIMTNYVNHRDRRFKLIHKKHTFTICRQPSRPGTKSNLRTVYKIEIGLDIYDRYCTGAMVMGESDGIFIQARAPSFTYLSTSCVKANIAANRIESDRCLAERSNRNRNSGMCPFSCLLFTEITSFAEIHWVRRNMLECYKLWPYFCAPSPSSH